MTRLTSRQVRDIPSSLAIYDASFSRRIGASLKTIGAYASGYAGDPESAFAGTTSRVVPITSGKGIISGFASAVASILEHVGLKSSVTRHTDVAGFVEAVEEEATIIFAADDSVFMGLNLKNKRLTYNHVATGHAYSAALGLRIGGLSGKKVSLLGIGRVGTAAAEYLEGNGAEVFAYDLNREKAKLLLNRFPSIMSCVSLDDCLKKGDYAISTVPLRGFIQERHIKEGAIFAIPAIPLGLTKAAMRRLGADNLIHDPLLLGVSAMAYDLVR